MITIQGKGVSAGIGMGPLYFYRRAKTEIPASILQMHPDFTLVADEAALSLI